MTSFPLDGQGQGPAQAAVVTAVGSATSEFGELPFPNAHMLQEVRWPFSCLPGMSGERQGKFSKIGCSSEKSGNGECRKKNVLIAASLEVFVICVCVWLRDIFIFEALNLF